MTPQELKYSILSDAFTGKLCENAESNDFGGIKTIELSETPFDVPETWVWSTLGLCCEMYTGNSISETVKTAKYAGRNTGYDYIATKDVTFNQEICYDNGIRIPYDEGFKVAYKGAVLMCIEGGSAGRKIGILDRDVCFGNKLCSFYVRGLDNKYLFYYLQSWLFKELFSENMTGIIGGVSIKKLKEIIIPVAPLAEQKRIVAKIEELLPYVDRYEQAWSRLENFNKRFPVDMQKSIRQMAIQGKLVPQLPEEGTGEELFQQIQAKKQALIRAGKIKKEKPLPDISENEIPFDIPESWKWVCLLEIVEEKPSNGYSPKGVDYITNIRNLTLTATTSGKFKNDAFKYVDISQEEASKYWLKHDDLLIQRSNSRELVGTSCIYTGNDNEYIYPDLMIRVRVCADMSVKYVDYVLKSPMVRSYYMLSASGTSESMPKINQNTVARTLIPLPPLAEQKRIVAKLEEILPLCERLK